MSKRMTKAEAIAALEAINPGDPERAHGQADEVLLALAGEGR